MQIDMNKKNIFFLLLSLFLLFSCGEFRQYRDVRTFSQSDIKESIHLTGEIIDLDEVFMPRRLFLVDSLIFTISSRQAHFVSVFHIRDMSRIGDFIGFGGGPNELMSVSYLQFRDSFVWAFDGRSSQINKYHLGQFLQAGEVIPLEIINLEDPFERALITSNRIITNSIHHLHSRFVMHDLQGNFIKTKGELPNSGTQMTDLETFMSYSTSSNMVLNPKDESIFIAYMSADLIEIYDSNGNLRTRVHGPDQFFTIRREVRDGGMATVRSIVGQTRDAYFNPVAFADEVWVLYNGRAFDPSEPYHFLCNRIIVFDWDGNPIREYITDVGIFSFAVDRENRVIYGLTISPDFTFVIFHF